jgi:hypothetical protein
MAIGTDERSKRIARDRNEVDTCRPLLAYGTEVAELT